VDITFFVLFFMMMYEVFRMTTKKGRRGHFQNLTLFRMLSFPKNSIFNTGSGKNFTGEKVRRGRSR
jgi:hypothetical protein